MKETYIKPKMVVVNVEAERSFLAGSDLNVGNKGSFGQFIKRRNDPLDDEENGGTGCIQHHDSWSNDVQSSMQQ